MTPAGEPSNHKRAEDAFASFLALREAARSEGRSPPEFDAWVAEFPQLESDLRQIKSDWSGFDSLIRDALTGPAGGTVFHRSPDSSSGTETFVEFVAGRTIGDFRLVQRIGQGGMGEVWEAEQLSLRRSVALKFIRPDRVTERAEAYFDREARAGGRLSHPGIVAVHATGNEGGLHWIAQELVPGSSTLRDFLKAVDPGEGLPGNYYELTARFMAELCDGLHAAHEAEVIHRDVKPHNILITPEDRPKLTDFGLARLTDEAAFSGSYALKGTPIYMSPEQVMGKTQLIDHRTDIYSAGAVLFEMLTLRRPFEGDSDEALARILADDPPDPSTLRPGVPKELGAIALKALERKPSARYPTAAAMADDLRRFVHHQPVRARPPGPLRRALKWAQRHPTASSVLVLGLALVGTAYFMGDRVHEASTRRDAAERDQLLTRALRAIDVGDTEAAKALTDQFKARYPDDARGPLTMATGYLLDMRPEDLAQELQEYAALGLDEPPSSGQGAASDELLRALHWQAFEGSEHAQVLASLEAAVALDPKLEFAFYPMYLAHYAQGNTGPAREALRKFRGTLRTNDSTLTIVDALLAELDEDYAAGVALLEQARAERSGEGFTQFRGQQLIGRMLIKLYRQSPREEHARLDQAEAELSAALEGRPNDFSALANLAIVHLLKHDRTPNLEQRHERLLASIDCSSKSLALNTRDWTAWQASALAKRRMLHFETDPEVRAGLMRDIGKALDHLEQRNPEDGVMLNLRAQLLFEQGTAAIGAGDYELARQHFQAAVDTYDSEINGRVMLAQLCFASDPEHAFELLLEAERIDQSFAAQGADHPAHWRFVLYVWLVGAADHAGEPEAAFDYAGRARALAENGEGVATGEAFTLAEFVALPKHAELRDCGLVDWLFETYPIEAEYRADHGELIDQVLAACEL